MAKRLLSVTSRCIALLRQRQRPFSDSRGQILDGKAIASSIRKNLKKEISDLKSKTDSKFGPCLAVIQVGHREDSNVYVRNKLKAAAEIGMETRSIKLPNAVGEAEVVDAIDELNRRNDVNGILLQLPLDVLQSVDTDYCINRIHPQKDVDGLTAVNSGRLARGEMGGTVIPCTPRGCLELIERTGTDIAGSNAVVIGRSKIVGSPMRDLLQNRNATVTVCHSKTKDMQDMVRRADIIVVAARQPQMVKGDWLKPGAIVIDCGINDIKDATKSKGYRLVGDVDYESCKPVASWITPVPKGVGPMTIAMLLQNTLECAKRQLAD
ncbi:C-1-tetrahydrofolate synthase, cytoplasmic-like [Oscarella lobularis]|uniref:C-1-tetrahydrofolate synthase, cytoplasmic-like n=1 Tax=Oscarella lobularis TaxID=121494 RepID=UPI0033140DE2